MSPRFWHLTTPILPILVGWFMALVYLSRAAPPTPPLHTPKGPRGATSDAKFQPGGPICKIRCYSLKNKQGKQSYHVMLVQGKYDLKYVVNGLEKAPFELGGLL